jgi:hypothetical protein
MNAEVPDRADWEDGSTRSGEPARGRDYCLPVFNPEILSSKLTLYIKDKQECGSDTACASCGIHLKLKTDTLATYPFHLMEFGVHP